MKITMSVKDSATYFMNNYDPLFHYTQNTGHTQWLSDENGRTCRFCGKRYPEVTFQKKAHAISEFTGNKEFVSKNECDICNEQFGKLLEDNFGKYLGAGRTISQIYGGEGVPSYKTAKGKSRIDLTDKGLVIQEYQDDPIIEKHDNYFIINTVRQAYVPIAVYKALVKFALSVLPYEYMPKFLDTTAWIKEQSNVISRFDMKNYLWCIERYIPGPRPIQRLELWGFIRKSAAIEALYYQFILAFDNYVYQIAVPCAVEDSALCGKKVDLYPFPVKVDFYGTSYGEITTFYRNMSSNEKVRNEPLRLCLSFTHIEEHDGNGMNSEDLMRQEGITIKKKSNGVTLR